MNNRRRGWFKSAVDPAPVGPPVLSTFGSLAGSEKCIGGALASNGCLYAAPYAATFITKINPSNDTLSSFGTFAAGNKWAGTVAGPDNRYLYGIPYDGTTVLKIDTLNDTSTTLGSLTSGGNKWIGGVLADNGCIYGIPFTGTTFLKIDTATDTVTTFGTISGNGKYRGGILGNDGFIYGVPSDATNILKLNPSNDTFTTFGTGIPGGGAKWSGGYLDLNNNLVAPNISSIATVLEVNLITQAVSQFGSYPVGLKNLGACLAPSGKGYAAPLTITGVSEIDSNLNTLTFLSSFSGTAKWASGCLAPNDAIYFFPYSGTSVLKISNVGIVTSAMVTPPSPISGLSASLYNKFQNKL